MIPAELLEELRAEFPVRVDGTSKRQSIPSSSAHGHGPGWDTYRAQRDSGVAGPLTAYEVADFLRAKGHSYVVEIDESGHVYVIVQSLEL